VLDSYGGERSGIVSREFTFVGDADLRQIVERDYRELRTRLFPGRAWKSTVVMAGSILEAILLDRLTRDAGTIAAANARRAHKGRDITSSDRNQQWLLSDLIDVTIELGFLESGDGMMTHETLREFRNLIHPRAEVRKKRAPSEGEAMAAVGALEIVCDHLK
jgi:hypothetical protein